MTANDALAAYLDEHLQGCFDAPAARTTIEVLAFRVGPFRFLCRADALMAVDGESGAAALDAAELVPAAYRKHLRPDGRRGHDVLRFKGGRLEIHGCQVERPLHLQAAAIAPRGPRADAPWISATTREPPAFVLDPDAAQLHFMRRQRPAG